jgi:hypothetical protein
VVTRHTSSSAFVPGAIDSTRWRSSFSYACDGAAVESNDDIAEAKPPVRPGCRPPLEDQRAVGVGRPSASASGQLQGTTMRTPSQPLRVGRLAADPRRQLDDVSRRLRRPVPGLAGATGGGGRAAAARPEWRAVVRAGRGVAACARCRRRSPRPGAARQRRLASVAAVGQGLRPWRAADKRQATATTREAIAPPARQLMDPFPIALETQ